MNDAVFHAANIDELQQRLGRELRYLEQHRGFTRYALSAEESAWTCDECGAAWVDPDEGCEHCGHGNPSDWAADENERMAMDDA
ncbi:MAG: hypothetical protein GVY22_18480 [Gammaproteobacteria bacterium]|jgi:rubrerythrin|nr:hypothetical protein [Gammaproteobacteria bacterium]